MEDEDAATPPKFANRIEKYRRRARLSLMDLAGKVGTSFQTLQRWEKKHPKLTIEKVEKLAAALGCTPYDLLPYHPKPINDPEISFVIERMTSADPATRRAIMRSVKGMTEGDEATFETRPKR